MYRQHINRRLGIGLAVAFTGGIVVPTDASLTAYRGGWPVLMGGLIVALFGVTVASQRWS